MDGLGGQLAVGDGLNGQVLPAGDAVTAGIDAGQTGAQHLVHLYLGPLAGQPCGMRIAPTVRIVSPASDGGLEAGRVESDRGS